jgi:hypothetical protein
MQEKSPHMRPLLPCKLVQLKSAKSAQSRKIYRLLLVSEETSASDYGTIPQSVRQGSPLPEPVQENADRRQP